MQFSKLTSIEAGLEELLQVETIYILLWPTMLPFVTPAQEKPSHAYTHPPCAH